MKPVSRRHNELRIRGNSIGSGSNVWKNLGSRCGFSEGFGPDTVCIPESGYKTSKFFCHNPDPDKLVDSGLENPSPDFLKGLIRIQSVYLGPDTLDPDDLDISWYIDFEKSGSGLGQKSRTRIQNIEREKIVAIALNFNWLFNNFNEYIIRSLLRFVFGSVLLEGNTGIGSRRSDPQPCRHIAQILTKPKIKKSFIFSWKEWDRKICFKTTFDQGRPRKTRKIGISRS